jgi:transitional endoplasmic reticulum ATPase
MSAPFEPRSAAVRRAGTNGYLRMTLRCARNVYDATDRRMAEATALAKWLSESASAFKLADADIPDEDALDRARCRGIAVQDWRKIGVALKDATRSVPDGRDTMIGRWLEVIAETLSLDPLEADILSLALHYRLEKRVDKLFDCLSESHGGPEQFHRDSALIALLLNAPVADVDSRLAIGARLQASGLLTLTHYEGLTVLERLLVLLRRDVSPEADLYDQLRGATTAEPLPWDAFAHLGREADLAAAILRAALDRRESGVNILLYGPPGTGKTSFAPTLAARIGARLRPVCPKRTNRTVSRAVTIGLPDCGWPRGSRRLGIRYCCSTKRRTCSSVGASPWTSRCRRPASLFTVCWSA